MAKGMDKRKKDAKKPKAEKPKVIAAAPSMKNVFPADKGKPK